MTAAEVLGAGAGVVAGGAGELVVCAGGADAVDDRVAVLVVSDATRRAW